MAYQVQDFTGKVAIVTGAGSGIREAMGGSAKGITVDVADAAAVAAMVQFTVNSFGGLDVGVNYAGIGGPLAPTGEYPLDGWRKVIDINLNGVFYEMWYQIPAMLARGGGAIVNVASILGVVGTANSRA